MKSKIVILFAALSAMLLIGCMTGCTTTTQITTDPFGHSVTNVTTHLDPQRTTNAIHSIVPGGVRLAVKADPKLAPYIQKAQVAVCAAAAAGKWSPSDIQIAINSSGIRELKDPQMELLIEGVNGIYQAYYADVVANHLDQNQWLLPILRTLCASLGEGLTPATVSISGINPST